MAVELLRVDNLRNIQALNITPSTGINLLYGSNAGGKTSVLESLHMLALARSFRTNRIASVITSGQEACQLFARITSSTGTSIPVGMSRRLDGHHQIRLNGETLQAASELAKLLPIQVIAPSNLDLLTAGPSTRRQFLDWGVFHYDGRFYELWKQLQRLIKQRNSTLKCANIDQHLLASFEPGLLQVCDALDDLRKTYMQALMPLVFDCLGKIIHLSELQMQYYRGWNQDKPLAQVLAETKVRDEQLGYTQRGAHRADIRFTIDGANAAEYLSRGQQKLATIALRLAQGQLLAQSEKRQCIFLVDDLGAELDKHSRRLVCQQLTALNTQVFITAVDKDELLSALPTATATSVFAVHQGQVTKES